jgi:Na+-driven multidrug efflux pump
MKLTMAANLVLSSLLAGTLLVFGRQILVFWIGEEAAGPTGTVLPWLAVAYWVLALNVVPYYVLLGIGQVKFVGLTVLASGLVSVIAMYFSIASFGLLGAPLGRGIYALLTLALVVPLWPYVRSGSSIENSKLGKHRTSGNGAGHT